MKKSELIEQLQAHTGGVPFITRAQLTKFLGFSNPRSVQLYLEGLDAVRGRLYYVPDVASRLMELRR